MVIFHLATKPPPPNAPWLPPVSPPYILIPVRSVGGAEKLGNWRPALGGN